MNRSAGLDVEQGIFSEVHRPRIACSAAAQPQASAICHSAQSIFPHFRLLIHAIPLMLEMMLDVMLEVKLIDAGSYTINQRSTT
ncbi:hypothetical protein ACSQ8M_17675 [Marinovum sp. B10]